MNTKVMVTTVNGKLRGYEEKGIKTFKGIPYAAPPVGANRFAPPQPAASWQGGKDALSYGPICPQLPSPPEFSKLSLPLDEAGCLTLNIWTPGLDDKRRPVMVWIHGGSLNIGSGAEYDGARLAARGDVVVVTINYRLNIFGFLYVPGKTSAVGMLDQIAALQWVKDNISAFGGDPDNVTAFGESAGAHSISILMGMPRAKGLFRRAILQSNTTTFRHHGAAAGEAVGRRVFSELGIAYGDLDALRQVPYDKLLAIYQKIELSTSHFDFYPPFVDGDLIPIHPLAAIKQGAAPEIEVLAGFNSDEATLFSFWDPGIGKLTEAELRQRLDGSLRFLLGDKYTARSVEEFYAVYKQAAPQPTPRSIWETLNTDVMFRLPLTHFMELQSRHQKNLYLYNFDMKTPEYGGVLGSPHALEICYVFGTLGEKANGIYPARSPETDVVSYAMMDAWTSFARSGNPNHKNLPTWHKFTLGTREHLVFGTEIKAVENPYAARDILWEGTFLI